MRTFHIWSHKPSTSYNSSVFFFKTTFPMIHCNRNSGYQPIRSQYSNTWPSRSTVRSAEQKMCVIFYSLWGRLALNSCFLQHLSAFNSSQHPKTTEYTKVGFAEVCLCAVPDQLCCFALIWKQSCINIRGQLFLLPVGTVNYSILSCLTCLHVCVLEISFLFWSKCHCYSKLYWILIRKQQFGFMLIIRFLLVYIQSKCI